MGKKINFKKWTKFINDSTFYLILFTIWSVAGAVIFMLPGRGDGIHSFVILLVGILGYRGEINYKKLKMQNASSFSAEDKIANFLCFMIDHYENQPLNENQIRRIGAEFLDSSYNKDRQKG